MIVAFACDHGGFPFRTSILEYLNQHGHTVIDVWPDSLEWNDDFPDFASHVCHVIRDKHAERGVLVCGTGIGMSIAANRYAWIRAVLSYSSDIAKISRAHNDANIICFGARTMTIESVIASLDIFFTEPFLGEKYQRRNTKLDSLC